MPRRTPTFRPRRRGPDRSRPTAAARGYCTAVWQRLRLAVIARDGGICQLCYRLVQGDHRDAHIDHIVPKAAGGRDELSNLRLLHASCHSRRTAAYGRSPRDHEDRVDERPHCHGEPAARAQLLPQPDEDERGDEVVDA